MMMLHLRYPANLQRESGCVDVVHGVAVNVPHDEFTVHAARAHPAMLAGTGGWPTGDAGDGATVASADPCRATVRELVTTTCYCSEPRLCLRR